MVQYIMLQHVIVILQILYVMFNKSTIKSNDWKVLRSIV